jgi:hypothetical protein
LIIILFVFEHYVRSTLVSSQTSNTQTSLKANNSSSFREYPGLDLVHGLQQGWRPYVVNSVAFPAQLWNEDDSSFLSQAKVGNSINPSTIVNWFSALVRAPGLLQKCICIMLFFVLSVRAQS